MDVSPATSSGSELKHHIRAAPELPDRTNPIPMGSGPIRSGGCRSPAGLGVVIGQTAAGGRLGANSGLIFYCGVRRLRIAYRLVADPASPSSGGHRTHGGGRPVVAFLMVIAAEMLIDILMVGGTSAACVVAAGPWCRR
jgi:hypothetical protein